MEIKQNMINKAHKKHPVADILEPIPKQHVQMMQELKNRFGVEIEEITRETHLDYEKLKSLADGTLDRIHLDDVEKLLYFYCYIATRQKSKTNKTR